MPISASRRRMQVSPQTQTLPVRPYYVSDSQAQRSGSRPRSISPDLPHRRRYHSEFAARDHSRSFTHHHTARNPSPFRQNSVTSNSRQRSHSTRTSERISPSSSRQQFGSHLSLKTYHPKPSQPSTKTTYGKAT
jgi:hypothetical protein